ncbi:hypothetical protein JG687_00000401 [Phytophthora cactorum]|uniref:Transmembrane protein TauE-like n=1 Tax=Phytophthora cactorum TaxID=29920 RepID=A0A329SV45_9STRA|nr:hypothetical protein Pcac1_g299 [Phytophthora cactorum]KAG2848846.1 hypothetical protein PC111_g268 [Phytophthora cactorum]KAG2849199.1 hypothetical protein PC112_g417 [Phytophthora cactorum]KAG2869043.1 hypothetical protein PC113_g502 [Phytophthora cactorum]KAG2935015.1 hypothetical protein PC114_g780 [Phytophthora cactorum]
MGISPTTARRFHHPVLSICVLLTIVTALPITVAKNGRSSSNDGESVRSLSEMDTYDVLAIVFMIIGLAVSSAGGIGGGVILVPAMVLIMGFDIKRATPISNVAILGGAVANTWFNVNKRHPTIDRPLIDAELALGMIPVVIGGTVLGAVINKLIPSYIVSILFVVVLSVSDARMTLRGIRLFKKEVAQKKLVEATATEGKADMPASPSEYIQASTPKTGCNDGVLVEKRLSISRSVTSEGFVAKSVEADETGAGGELAQILENERQFAWGPHLAILTCYLGVVAASIGDASVNCGGVAYWVILLIEIPWVAGFVLVTSHYLYKVYLRKVNINYQYVEGDIKWTKRNVVLFPLGCAFAGIVAGMFGVGGGVITGPIMIEMGIVPEVASSTMALMILYSSAAATAKFAVFDMIAWDWAALLCAVAFLVTSASQIVILGFVRRTGRQSIIILCISASVTIGTLLMTYQAIKITIDDAGSHFSVDICT